MVAYAGAGADCAGTVDGAGGLPSLQARPYDAKRTAGEPEWSRHSWSRTTNPGYMYDLVRHWPDEVPNGGTVDGTGRSVAALVENYNGMGSTSADGLRAVEELIGWVPEPRRRRQHRPGPRGASSRRPSPTTCPPARCGSGPSPWSTPSSAASTAGSGRRAGRSRVAARTHDTWFGGPIGSRVSPLFTVDNGAPPPTREGDELFLSHRCVHRCGRPHGALGHLQQRVQRPDLRR